MSASRTPYERITRERLQGWGERLIEAQATPLLLIGVGQGANQGNLHICIPEDLPHERALLIGALRAVMAGLEAED